MTKIKRPTTTKLTKANVEAAITYARVKEKEEELFWFVLTEKLADKVGLLKPEVKAELLAMGKNILDFRREDYMALLTLVKEKVQKIEKANKKG
mgnify:CR=1 FL=1